MKFKVSSLGFGVQGVKFWVESLGSEVRVKGLARKKRERKTRDGSMRVASRYR